MARKSAAHPGFASAAASIAKREHMPIAGARAVLAAGARRASAKAKRANPRLKRVKG